MTTSITNHSWFGEAGKMVITYGNLTSDHEFNADVDHDIETKVEQVIKAASAQQFHIFLPSFVIICILLAVGLPGNVLALVIYHKKVKRAIAKNFLITMCICDTLTCAVVMPIELDLMRYYFEYDQEWLCKSFRFFAYSVNNVSSLTLVAIAVERYRIICNPWKPKFSEQLSQRICCCTVVLSILASVPMAVMYGTQTIPLGNVTRGNVHRYKAISANCTGLSLGCNKSDEVQGQTTSLQQMTKDVVGKSCLMDSNMIGSSFPIYVVSIYISSIVIVFIIFIYLYSHVIRMLARRRKKSMCQQQNNGLQGSSNKRMKHVTVMAIILTVTYEVCYLPCLVAVCIRLAYPGHYMTLTTSGKRMFDLMLKSYLLNSAINPFIYCFCNREFRLGLYMLLRSFKVTFLPSKQDSVGDTNTKSFSETAFR